MYFLIIVEFISVVLVWFALLHWILHRSVVWLFPFWFAWWISSLLLRTSNQIISVHWLSLGHYSSVATSVTQHFVVTTWVSRTKGLSTNHILFFMLLLVLLIVLTLPFNVHRALWSDSIFRRCWWRFLTTCTLFSTSHHVWRWAAYQIVVLLDQTKRIWWRTSMMLVSTFWIQTICIRTSRSFLCCSWS